MSSPWVAIQRNPRSGSGRRRRHLLDLIDILKRKGLRPRLFSNRERLADRLQDQAARESLVCIVAAGGDGTISDVINRYQDIPVCPFPLGTENLLCRHFGIRPDGEQVAEIISNGKRIRMDVGLVGANRFLLMASAGFDAEVIRRLHDNRKGNISHLSYLKPIFSTVLNFHYPRVRVLIDDVSEPLIGSLAVVSNVAAYARGLPITPDAKPDDGLLDVCVFRDPGVFRLFQYWLRVRRKAHLSMDGVTFAAGSRIRMESDESVPVQIDGDPAGATPCELSVLPGAMELFVPA